VILLIKRIASSFLLILIIISVFIRHHALSYSIKPIIISEGKFSPGDNPLWRDPLYDDSLWKKIEIPGSWQSYGFKPSNGVGWYRLHFYMPNFKENFEVGVSLGFVGDSEEVFVNGIWIGAYGRVGNRFVDATNVERLYKIPSGVLKSGKDNLIAVRVMNTYGLGGIYRGIVRIGDYRELLIDKLNRDIIRKSIEVSTIMALFIIIFTWAFLYVFGMRNKEYLFFGLFLLCFLIPFTLDGLMFYDTGLKSSLVQQIIYGCYSLLPPLLLLFIVFSLNYRLNLFIKGLLAFSFAHAITIFLFGTLNYRIANIISLLWVIEIIAFMVCGIHVMFVSRKKIMEHKMVIFGILSFYLIGFIEIVTYFNWNTKSLTNYYGIVILIPFILSTISIMTRRFIQIRQREKLLLRHVLSAYEEERQRIARDIHDGPLQSLLAMRLYMLALNKKMADGTPFAKDELLKVISEIANTTEELRNIINGLCPSFLKKFGIGECLRLYGRVFQERTGIRTEVDINDEIEISPEIKLHIFRICQEALSNVFRHSGADRTNITLKKYNNKVILKIKDNGIGFKKRYSNESQKGGFGLNNIRERTSLLGGIFNITTPKEGGTEVIVEVPLK